MVDEETIRQWIYYCCFVVFEFVRSNLLLGDVDVAAVNGLNDRLGRLAINLAANTVGGSENLLDGTREVLGERLVSHGAGDLNDLVEGDRLVVLDVLLLLAVAWGLLEGLDDERRSSGNNRDGSLTVLDGKLDSYAQAFLLKIVSIFLERRNMLGNHTQSPVALAMSSPTFLGERPRGPILGARAEEAPTSPPVARRWLQYVSFESTKYPIHRINLHHLNLIGVELGSCSSR